MKTTLEKIEIKVNIEKKIINIPKDKRGDQKYMPVGMSKKVYKEMVKEMDKIASRKESSQQQCASQVCNHWFILLFTSNLIIAWNINFQLVCCINEIRSEPI